MQCAVHKVETYVRCGKCDTPICPDCMLVGPAGVRCRDCAALRSSPLYQVPADRLALGIVAGLLVGSFGGFLLAAAAGIGFFVLWLGLLVGYGVGEAILRVMYRKRGVKVEAAAGICAALGGLAGLVIWLATHGAPVNPQAILGFLAAHPFYIFGVGIAAFSAVGRTRFF